MKRIHIEQILSSLVILITLILLSGCSEVREELPAPTASLGSLHAEGWNAIVSTNFHGKVLKQAGYKLDECTACHSKQFTGGTSGSNCYTCHSSYPHWKNPAEPTDHKAFLKKHSWDHDECSNCHGADYKGGTSGKSCINCHKHYPHAVNYNSGHGGALKAANYPLSECKSCHGSSYQGGSTVNVSCSKSGCHMDASGVAKSPEACNTCHGNFRAPANDLVSTMPLTGGHQKHLTAGSISTVVKCAECHTVPATTFVTGHLDATPRAEVVFNEPLARTTSAGIVPTPVFNTSTSSCSNSYCHGNWKIRKANSAYQYVYTDSVMVGANDTPLWNGGAAEASCGSCHGIPPKGHVPASLVTCQGCHTGVVDDFGRIKDVSKHMNGKINVFGQERILN